MATATDIETPLALELNGPVTPELFLRGVQSFFALVGAVTKRIEGEAGKLEWLVQVKKGSNLVGILPDGLAPDALVSQIVQELSVGVEHIEREATEPRSFEENELRAISAIGRLAVELGGSPSSVRIWADREPLTVTQRAVSHVSELLDDSFEEHGAIQGVVKTVSERGGFKFVIYEPLRDRAIRCFIPEHRMADAIAAFGRRVEVYGTITYRRDGNPSKVKVDDIVLLPDANSLPSYQSIRGILRNLH